jgi:hypothetical protein
MAFWNKKKKEEEISDDARFLEIVKELKGICERDDSMGVVLLAKNSASGTSYVQGSMESISFSIRKTCMQDKTFATIISKTAKEVESSRISNDKQDFLNSLPKELRDAIFDIENSKDKSKLVDLPNGQKGVMVKGDNIDDLSDEDIDDIVNNMLKGINDRDEGESKE